MAIDLGKLAGQGRAYSAARAWEPEELDALLLLESSVEQGGRGIGRQKAADYIRNGIMTVEAYDKAVEAEFKPKTLEAAASEVEASLKDNEFAKEPEVEAAPEIVTEETPVQDEVVADSSVDAPKKGKK